ncbi:MAG: O-antigen ligase family protein [Solirubrobacterales bacterium]
MRVGPSRRGGDPERFRAQLEGWTAFAAPAILILALALAGGGYDVTPRHIAGLAVWLFVVLLLALGAASRAALAKPFYWASGLILSLALFSALSSVWSGSVEISVIEADRVLIYLGVFFAAFLIAQTDHSRQRFGEGLWIALLGVAVLMLATRLLPHVFPVAAGLDSGSRIRYPLGYWNANGVACAIGVALSLWISRRSTVPVLRWVAVGGLPVLLLALYLTYSRGSLLALVVASICLIALSHDRLWLLCTLAVGALSALPAVLYVQGHTAISQNANFSGVIGQGVAALLYLVGGVLLALALHWGLRRLERGGGELTGRALALSRDRRVLRAVAIGAAVLALIAAVAVGQRAWDQFTSSDIEFSSDPDSRIGSFSGSGRDEFFRVALDAFDERPLLGHGAGTYQFSWFELRDIDVPVHNAHSLYLQAFAELGIVGGVLTLATVLALLWIGFSAWRAAGGPQRELYAALFAAALAFAVAAAIDWLWQIAALGFAFFLASGALVAARCGQLSRRRATGNGRGRAPRRYGLAVAGLAVAWLTALALVGPLLVDREIDASKSAAAAGEIERAVEHANTARSIEPWAATPYVQLGLLAQAQSDYATAVERLGQAIDREDQNWILYYLRAKAQHEAGNTAAAEADLGRAQQLNPLEACLTKGWDGCG